MSNDINNSVMIYEIPDGNTYIDFSEYYSAVHLEISCFIFIFVVYFMYVFLKDVFKR